MLIPWFFTRRGTFVANFGLCMFMVAVLGFCFAAWSSGCFRPSPQPPPQVGGSGQGGASVAGASGGGMGGTAGASADAGLTDAATDAPVPPGPRPVWNAGDVCASASALFDWAACPRAGADGGSWADVCRNARKNGLTFGLTKPVQACLSKADGQQAIVACGEKCPVKGGSHGGVPP